MAEFLDSKWVYWIVTGVIGALLGAITWFIRRQREMDDKRFKKLEAERDHTNERLNKLISELPLTYTLRDEFLRVTTQQTSKLDKIYDMVSEIGRNVTGLQCGKQDK